jgi:hypothetical protein
MAFKSTIVLFLCGGCLVPHIEQACDSNGVACHCQGGDAIAAVAECGESAAQTFCCTNDGWPGQGGKCECNPSPYGCVTANGECRCGNGYGTDAACAAPTTGYSCCIDPQAFDCTCSTVPCVDTRYEVPGCFAQPLDCVARGYTKVAPYCVQNGAAYVPVN